MYRENSPTPHHRAEIGAWAPEDMQARVLRNVLPKVPVQDPLSLNTRE